MQRFLGISIKYDFTNDDISYLRRKVHTTEYMCVH